VWSDNCRLSYKRNRFEGNATQPASRTPTTSIGPQQYSRNVEGRRRREQKCDITCFSGLGSECQISSFYECFGWPKQGHEDVISVPDGVRFPPTMGIHLHQIYGLYNAFASRPCPSYMVSSPYLFYLIHATKQGRHPQGICGKATLTKEIRPAAGPRPVSYHIGDTNRSSYRDM